MFFSIDIYTYNFSIDYIFNWSCIFPFENYTYKLMISILRDFSPLTTNHLPNDKCNYSLTVLCYPIDKYIWQLCLQSVLHFTIYNYSDVVIDKFAYNLCSTSLLIICLILCHTNPSYSKSLKVQ